MKKQLVMMILGVLIWLATPLQSLAQSPLYTNGYFASINNNWRAPCGQPGTPTQQMTVALSQLPNGGTLDMTCYPAPITITQDIFSPISASITIILPPVIVSVAANATIPANFAICGRSGGSIVAAPTFTLTNNSTVCGEGNTGNATTINGAPVPPNVMLATNALSQVLNTNAQFADPNTTGTTTCGINEAVLRFGAIPACGQVVLPYGLCPITTEILGAATTSGRTGCDFLGQGAADNSAAIVGAGTYLKWGGAANGTVMSLIGCHKCTAQNFTIDGSGTAGIGFEQTSDPGVAVSDGNEINNLYIYSVLGTPGYGIHVGESTNHQVSESNYSKVHMVNVKQGAHQDGTNTLNITYGPNIEVSNASDSCLDLEAGSALDLNFTCTGIQTGATGSWIIKNSVAGFTAVGDYNEGGGCAPNFYAPGTLNSGGPQIIISGGQYGTSCFGQQIGNFTQNGTLSLLSNKWGNNSGYLTFSPLGSSVYTVGKLVTEGNNWNQVWVQTSGYGTSEIRDRKQTGGVGAGTPPLSYALMDWLSPRKDAVITDSLDYQLFQGRFVAPQFLALDTGNLGTESLNDPTFASGATDWTATGGWTLSGGTATFAGGSGSGTLTQSSLAVALLPNTLYTFSYQLASVVGQPNLTIDTPTASGQFSILDYVGSKSVTFMTGANPTSFVLHSFNNGGNSFQLVSVSLKQVLGGDVKATHQLVSLASTGTAPLSVASSTLVTNLNAAAVGGVTPGNTPSAGNVCSATSATACLWGLPLSWGLGTTALIALYRNSTNVYTKILDMPSVPAGKIVSGQCSITWEQQTTAGWVKFGMRSGQAPTGFWITDTTGTVTYTSITDNLTHDVTPQIIPGATATPYSLNLTFTLQTGVLPPTVSLYGVPNNVSNELDVEPGSYCNWNP